MILQRRCIMQTVQIQVDDRYFDAFLALVSNLKEGMVKSIKVDKDALSSISQQHEINKTYFQHALDEVEMDTTPLISHDDVWAKVNVHIKAHS